MFKLDPLWTSVGLLAQALFSARFLVQWILSERARKSLMPIHFWYFSIGGSALLLAYAAHQRDLVIVLGQMLGLAIYQRNLELIHRAEPGRRALSWFWPWLGFVVLGLAAGYASTPAHTTKVVEFHPFWSVFGLVGQTLFTGRFVLQWFASERAQGSVTPIHFWYLSMIGSSMLLTYAIAQRDPVIILGQTFGIVVYLRNLRLIRRQDRRRTKTAAATETAS